MVTAVDLINHFGLRLAFGNAEMLRHVITITELDRPGVELLGNFQFHRSDRILILGNKELDIIRNSPYDEIYKNSLRLCDPACPAIIIAQGAECPTPLLQAAKERKTPILLSDADTNQLISKLYIYLSEALAPTVAMHACLLEVFGIGVMIFGESGIGKSEISLGLIKKGHRLVADDRVNISAVRGELIGSCPESIYGMMEVRGIGIIDVARMFGINSLGKKAQIQFIVELVPFDKTEPLERVGMKTNRYEILGETVPIVRLPVSAARNMTEIIEAAVTNFKLKDYGYDTGYEFEKRLSKIQNRKNAEAKLIERFVTLTQDPTVRPLKITLADEKNAQRKVKNSSGIVPDEKEKK